MAFAFIGSAHGEDQDDTFVSVETTLHASATSGDTVVILLLIRDSSLSVTPEGDWELLHNVVIDDSGEFVNSKLRVYSRQLDGTGDDDITFNFSGDCYGYAFITYTFREADGVEISGATTGTNSVPDSGNSLGYSGDAFSIAVAIAGGDALNGALTVSSYPSGYGTGQLTKSFSFDQLHGEPGYEVEPVKQLVAASIKSVTSSDNPGAWTLSRSAPWAAVTVEVRGLVVPGPITIEAGGLVEVGGAAIVLQTEPTNVAVLACCATSIESTPRVRFGSATWHAYPEHDADGIARYYPLWLDAHELLTAVDLNGNPDAVELARIRSRGRDIANQIDASAFGDQQPSDNGRLCETPEQFRTGRYYEIPLFTLLPEDEEPVGRIRVPPPDPLQFEWEDGFTLTALFRRVDIKRETTLFTLDPSLRLGVTWLGELALELIYDNGSTAQAWSTLELSTTALMHVALRVDFRRGEIAVFVDGVRVLTLAITRPLATVQTAYFGHWSGASLLNGDAQDLRFYREIKSTEFLLEEQRSYCADWIEVVS